MLRKNTNSPLRRGDAEKRQEKKRIGRALRRRRTQRHETRSLEKRGRLALVFLYVSALLTGKILAHLDDSPQPKLVRRGCPGLYRSAFSATSALSGFDLVFLRVSASLR
jgi:hypothetical protein